MVAAPEGKGSKTPVSSQIEEKSKLVPHDPPLLPAVAVPVVAGFETAAASSSGVPASPQLTVALLPKQAVIPTSSLGQMASFAAGVAQAIHNIAASTEGLVAAPKIWYRRVFSDSGIALHRTGCCSVGAISTLYGQAAEGAGETGLTPEPIRRLRYRCSSASSLSSSASFYSFFSCLLIVAFAAMQPSLRAVLSLDSFR